MSSAAAVKALASRAATSGQALRSTTELSREALAACPVCVVLGPARRLDDHVTTDHPERPKACGPGHLFRAGQLDQARAIAGRHGLRVADIVMAALDEHFRRLA